MFLNKNVNFEIEILVVPDATLLLVAAAIEPMRAANRILGREHFRWSVSSPDGAPAMTASGVPIPAERAFDPGAADAPLLVLASYRWRERAGAALIEALRQAGPRRAMICGAESGVWLMAEAGLLNRRRATVHWEDLEAFGAAYPEVEACDERFVIDGPAASMGGASPTLDFFLEIVSAEVGFPIAFEVARLFLYDQARFASEPQRGASALAPVRDPRVAAALELMARNIETPLSIEAVAAEVELSPRRLQTLFLEELSVGPHAHYFALRLTTGRRLMIETRQSVAEAAVRCGFASAGAFARAYRARYGESPTETRRKRGRAG